MKFANVSTVLFVLLPFAHAAIGSPKEDLKTSKAQIVVQGVPQDFSKEDLSVINKSAIAAFNAVQHESSYSLVDVKPLLHFAAGDSVSWPCRFCPPDDDSFALGEEQKVLVADVQVKTTWPCRFCPPDDDAVALGDTNNHQLFVESFCNLLATSGAPNLAHAHHCSFSFLEDPGHHVPPLSLLSNDKSEAAKGFLSITGLIHKLSAEDIAIVESSALETYNQAFAKTAGYSEFAALQVKSAAETTKDSTNVAWPCRFCPPDDDSFELDAPSNNSVSTNPGGLVGSVLVLDIELAPKDSADVAWPCRFCPPDDDSFEANTVSIDTLAMAFSKALCSKLHNSGSPNLAFVGDCAFDFFYEHDLEPAQEA